MMKKRHALVGLAAGLIGLVAGVAHAAEYEGHVPPGLREIGETWPGFNSAQILMCATMTPASLRAKLAPEARTQWFGMCASANRVHAQFKAGGCWQDQTSAVCREAVQADTAIRQHREFWAVVNALNSRPDEYGLEEP